MTDGAHSRPDHLFSVRLFCVAAAFGCAALFVILAGFHFQVPGTNTVTDPREVFVLIGAALTGPIGGLITGIIASLGDPSEGATLYIVMMHMLGAAWVGWAYKRFVHDTMPMPVMLLGWVAVVFTYYFVCAIPVVTVTKFLFPDYFLSIMPEPRPIVQTLMVLFRGWFMEFVLATVLTSAILLALPRRARAPLWWTRRLPRVVASITARPPRNIIALRLTLWVLLLSCVPLVVMMIFLRSTLIRLSVEQYAADAVEIASVLTRTARSEDELVRTLQSTRLMFADSLDGRFILDQNGRIAWHPDSLRHFADARSIYGKAIIDEILKLDSGYVYDEEMNYSFAYARIPSSSRRLVFITDVDISTGLLRIFIRSTLIRFGLALVLVAIIAGLVIWLIIGRPVRLLAHAARRIGRNDLEARVDPEFMSDEVGILGQAFNEMAENLDILHRGLQSEIEERRATEQALRESERRFREMADLLPLTVYEVDLQGRFRFTNRAASEMFRFPADGRPENLVLTDYIMPDDRQRATDIMRQVIETGTGTGNEYLFRRVDGSSFPGLVYSSVVREGERLTGMRGIVIDISEQKRAQQALRNSVTEKEVMLQEIHHRVKNNLQIVSSLLSLQAASIEDRTYLTLFQESVDRIRSMALIHDRLYKSRDFAGIEFRDYIESLVMSLFHSYGRPGIRYNTEVQDVRLAIDTAVPFGLVVNELVTNALKHAFPGGRQGSITVSLVAKEAGEVELAVADDGVGIPEGFDATKTSSLGLQLVKILTDQLAGTLEIRRGNGTTFCVLLPPMPVRNGTLGGRSRPSDAGGNAV